MREEREIGEGGGADRGKEGELGAERKWKSEGGRKKDRKQEETREASPDCILQSTSLSKCP